MYCPIAMTFDATAMRRIRLAFHGLGLSCLGGAIFLQILVFSDIFYHGYFRAVEGNPIILGLEIGLTAYAAIYFIYIYRALIRQIR